MPGPRRSIRELAGIDIASPPVRGWLAYTLHWFEKTVFLKESLDVFCCCHVCPGESFSLFS